MPGRVPSSANVPAFTDRIRRFTREEGASEIFNLAIGWKDRDGVSQAPEINQVTHLYLNWDPSAWDEFQDDAYAAAFNALRNSTKLKLLSIEISGPARFTEYDYVLITPESELPKDLLKRNMPELCSASPLTYSKTLNERPSIDLQRYGAQFHRTHKACISALLALRNVSTLRIMGPMEIALRRKIFAVVPLDPNSTQHQLGAGLVPPEAARRTETLRAWEEEMMTIRLGEDVVRICTAGTADDDAANREDDRVRDRMYGAKKAGLTTESRRLTDKEKEWVLPTSRTARVVIGWRAAGRMPSWKGPDGT
ncbi:MAG: hypothetical protein M1822_005453 [Bathelium mastoideum]|nr:MAG: hypothetical protein M1822_005453 [Bathelium mastoideum]